jgi:ADP-heptose:LPS heptosyltransferase
MKRLIKFLDARLGPSLLRAERPRAREIVSPARFLAPGEAESILLVRPGGMGDAVLTLPLIAALRRYFPSARLDVLAEGRNAGVYRIAADGPTVIRYDRGPLATFRDLARRRYDLVVETEQFHRFSTLYANRLAPRWLVGFDTLDRRKFQTHSASYSEEDYEVYSFLRLFRALTGVEEPFDPDRPFLEPAEDHRRWSAERLLPLGTGPLAAVMPSAGAAHRVWPAGRLAEACLWLQERGFALFFVGGSDAREPARAVASVTGTGPEADFTGAASLAQTAALLERARLCLTPDTGVLHLASAVGTPTVGLFGSGLDKKWAPPGRFHRAVFSDIPCRPCTAAGQTPRCPRDGECMKRITVDMVTKALASLIEERGVMTERHAGAKI